MNLLATKVGQELGSLAFAEPGRTDSFSLLKEEYCSVSVSSVASQGPALSCSSKAGTTNAAIESLLLHEPCASERAVTEIGCLLLVLNLYDLLDRRRLKDSKP